MPKSSKEIDAAYIAARNAEGFYRRTHLQHWSIDADVAHFVAEKNAEAAPGKPKNLIRIAVWAHPSITGDLYKWVAEMNKEALKVDE